MSGPHESAVTEASLGAPRTSTSNLLMPSSATSSAGSGVSSAAKTALEHQRRIEREELVSDTLRLRWLSVVGAGVWVAFGIDDWLNSRFVEPLDLYYFWTIRAVALVPILYVVGRLRSRRKMSRVVFMLHDIGIFCVLQASMSLMCIRFHGITSPLFSGLLVALIARSSILAAPWKRGLLTLGVPLLMYPTVFGIAGIVLPEIRRQFLNSPELATFTRHLFVLSASLGICVWGGHGNWALRRQLFETRNIGRYRLKRRIGRGGMGEVWVAYHSGLQRDVALKVLRPDDEVDPIAVRRFEQEVAATCRLTHPNTVRVFDYGVTDDGIWYYAMELLEGYTLYELVRQQGPLPLERTLLIGHQASRALAEAHARSIVHRDVKPENIFITRAGDEPDFVKVLDFGIAKLCGEARGATLTQTGAVFGTPAYISPEAAKGQTTSSRSDVYGLGAVLYYMLAGRPPFVAANPAEVLMAHITQPVPPLNGIPGVSVPKDVSELIMRCLEKDATSRFADAGVLAAELARLVTKYSGQPATLGAYAC
ncbi:MAG TPA: serine/threonine-protein kinase [Polyangiaceae bacterium]